MPPGANILVSCLKQFLRTKAMRRFLSATSVCATLVKARWAFSELASARFAHLYDGYFPAQILRDKSIAGHPFSALNAVDLSELNFVYAIVRGRYLYRYLNVEYFDEITIEKSDLNNICVLPILSDQRFVSVPDWAAWPAADNRRDIKRLLRETRPKCLDFAAMPPLTAGLFNDQLLLVDGYFRALLFLRDGLPNDRLNIYIPTL